MTENSTPGNQALDESLLNASLKTTMWFIGTEAIGWISREPKLFKAACLSQDESISAGLLHTSSWYCWLNVS